MPPNATVTVSIQVCNQQSSELSIEAGSRSSIAHSITAKCRPENMRRLLEGLSEVGVADLL